MNRLAIPEIIPNVENVFYIDSDTIVFGNLGTFIKTDIKYMSIRGIEQ